ncbi:hypothetical protein B591_30863 (plasmid) [Streptomyces sp. GBA 94-10 4N24]|nr:hypothetical protein B591_30863 [Streptomyces sp. GBA 94-10 4N24]UZN63152.1 hypothetical protein B591N_30863 [Streptomyces sp. GBA 94-10 4N24]
MYADGASPRVRGRHRQQHRALHRLRSIPAGAGPTVAAASTRSDTAEHPRGCGADITPNMTQCAGTGASPRVRGRRARTGGHGHHQRSIPAGAGPTGTPTARPSPTREHPRGCGADPPPADDASPTPGASPRVRGRRPPAQDPGGGGGSIPAGAGPTWGRP